MLGRRLGNQRQGLIAAAIAAVLPALVVNDHFAMTDTALMFWTAASLYLLLRAYDNWERDTLWAYAGAAFACGLAASTKYNGVLLAVPLLLVPLLRVRSLDKLLSLRVMIGPLAMVGGFFMTTPYAVLDPPLFLRWFGYILHLQNAPGQVVAMPVWLWHARYHLSSPHAPVIILGGIGLVGSFWRWGARRALIVNSFAVILLVTMVGQTNAQLRTWIPAASLFILWTALVADIVIVRIGNFLTDRRKDPRWAYAILALLLLPLLYFSLRYDLNFRRGDVRQLAQQWVAEHVPPDTSIAVDYFHPNLDPLVWPQTRTFNIFDHDYQWYVDQGVEYLVLNEALADFARQPPEAYTQYQELLRNVCEVGRVHGPFLATTEFDIKIYQLGPCDP